MRLFMAIIIFYGGYWIGYGENQMSYGKYCIFYGEYEIGYGENRTLMATITSRYGEYLFWYGESSPESDLERRDLRPYGDGCFFR
jgi:hypothetical protein